MRRRRKGRRKKKRQAEEAEAGHGATGRKLPNSKARRRRCGGSGDLGRRRAPSAEGFARASSCRCSSVFPSARTTFYGTVGFGSASVTSCAKGVPLSSAQVDLQGGGRGENSRQMRCSGLRLTPLPRRQQAPAGRESAEGVRWKQLAAPTSPSCKKRSHATTHFLKSFLLKKCDSYLGDALQTSEPSGLLGFQISLPRAPVRSVTPAQHGWL